MLKATQISFGYRKTAPLFESLDFSLDSGECVALSAPSGYGKTTLCALLSGYESPWRGSITVDNEPLPEKGVCPVQLVGQHPELAFDPRLTLERSLREAGTLSGNLLDALGISEVWLSRQPHELSGGELQRFAIARALMVCPRYLIADEISTMLDAVTQARIWNYLYSWVQEESLGLLFVSHSRALVNRLATRVVDLRGLIHD